MIVCPGKHRADLEVEGLPVWCRACGDQIIRAIASLPGLAAGIYQMGSETGRIVGSTDLNGGRTATRIHAPTASPAWEAIDELLTWATGAERDLRRHLGHASSPRWKGGTTELAAAVLRRSTGYLVEWSTALLCCPFADELGQVVAMARRAERACGLDRHTIRLTKACPRCGKPRLVRDDGAESVRCRSCGSVLVGRDLAKVFDTTSGPAA